MKASLDVRAVVVNVFRPEHRFSNFASTCPTGHNWKGDAQGVVPPVPRHKLERLPGLQFKRSFVYEGRPLRFYGRWEWQTLQFLCMRAC